MPPSDAYAGTGLAAATGLPVVVSTRDGHRFGFFPLAEGAAEA